VEAVGSVAWMKSGAEEGFRRPGIGSMSSPECRGALSLVVGCSQEKEWRGWSTPFCGRVGLRKKRGKDGGGSVWAAPCGGRTSCTLGLVTPRGGGRCRGGPGAGRGTQSVGADDGRLAGARKGTNEGGGLVGRPRLGRCHGSAHAHNVETQDTELEERAEMITNLEQQLLELQVQAQPEPADPEEINVMSDINED
jgi:hypothetical protein